MRLYYALLALLTAATFTARAQAPASVGIGTTTPNTKAALDISATGKGLLIPRMDSAARAQIASPPDGLIVFQTNGRRGFWYAFGGAWLYIPDKTKSGDNLGSHTATQNLNLGTNKLVGNGGSQGLSVTNSGNVGIGTTAPTAALHVAGGARITGLGNGSTQQLVQVASDGTLTTGAVAPGTLISQPGPSNALGSASITAPSSIVVNGSTAYVLSLLTNTLQTINVSNPANPTLLGSVATGPNSLGIAVSGSTAYVVNADSRTLQTFNVSNPATPTLLGSVATGLYPLGVAVSGTTAFVVNYTSNNLQTFNVSNPASPLLLGSAATGIGPYSVAVSGSTAYVINAGDSTLQTFNVSNPANLTLLGSVATGLNPLGVAVSGNTAFVVNSDSNSLQTFNVSNPAAPTLLGSVATDLFPCSVAVSGTIAFVVSGGNNTIQLFNVSNPTSPTLLGAAATDSEPYSVATSGTTAYVTNYASNTLQTFQQLLPGGLVGQNPNGSLVHVNPATLSDNLGNHTATQNLNLGANQLVGNGGNNGVFISNAGNVGIGTTSPTQKLHVAGQVYSSTGGFRFPDNTIQTTAAVGDNLGNHTATQNLNLGANQLVGNGGSTGLTISNTGNVGIGTTSPAARLTVSGTESTTHGNNAALLLQNTAASTANTWTLRTGGSGTATPDGGFSIGDNAAYRLSISNAGNVGIGTTSPAQKLDVNGNLRLQGQSGGSQRLLVADEQGDVQVSRYYSSSGTVSSAGTTTTHTYNHNLGYAPVMLISLESSEANPALTVAYENISANQTVIRVYNAGVGAKSYTVHAIPVR